MFKNFFCEREKCSKQMKKNFLHCAKCFKKFCCNKCINDHLRETHQYISTKSLPKISEAFENENQKGKRGITKEQSLKIINNIPERLEVTVPQNAKIIENLDKNNESQSKIDSTNISHIKKESRISDLNDDIDMIDQPVLEVAENSLDEPEEEETAKPTSLFLKTGIYLGEYHNESFYDFKNFELRRDQPLGKGAFGDVITGVHKKTGKKYAIKQVKLNSSCL